MDNEFSDMGKRFLLKIGQWSTKFGSFSEMDLVKDASHNHVPIFMFYTLQEWEGTDDEVFWAKCDEDLIAQMIAHVHNI